MGWWKINSETGEPLKEEYSALSKPPDKILLNAVPGVDDEDAACYLGDGPWDMASTVPDEIAEAIGDGQAIPDEQLRDLFLKRQLPPGDARKRPEVGARLLKVVDAFWKDIDSCYQDDWERPARPEEKRWVFEYVLKNQQAED